MLVLITGPTEEPLTREEVAEHLRLEEPDAYSTALVTVARQHVEAVTSRALCTQTWELVLDAFPQDGVVRLGKGKLQSVTSVTYLDSAHATQTLAADQYQVDTVSEPGRVVRQVDVDWPVTSGRINAVRVRFVAGYGSAAAVPLDLKQAMLMLIANLYENRETEIIGTINSRLPWLEALLSPHRVPWDWQT